MEPYLPNGSRARVRACARARARMTLDRTIIWIGLIPIWRYGNGRTAGFMPCSYVWQFISVTQPEWK
jgi:hypothetical protein